MTWRLAQFSICCTGTAGTARARLQRLRENSGFVSGYRFSDTVGPPKPDAPLGAGIENRLFPQTVQPCRQGLQRVSASAAGGNASHTITKNALALLLGTLALSTHWLSTQCLAQSVPGSQSPTSPSVVRLTVKDAEALALKNNPAISVARLSALASKQVTREVSSNLWPQTYANLTAVDAENNSRITAGALNNPTVYARAAGGFTVTQLITDFGHHEPGRQRPPPGKSRRTERGSNQRGNPTGRGPGLLQYAADSCCAASGRADRSLAAVVI